MFPTFHVSVHEIQNLLGTLLIQLFALVAKVFQVGIALRGVQLCGLQENDRAWCRALAGQPFQMFSTHGVQIRGVIQEVVIPHGLVKNLAILYLGCNRVPYPVSGLNGITLGVIRIHHIAVAKATHHAGEASSNQPKFHESFTIDRHYPPPCESFGCLPWQP